MTSLSDLSDLSFSFLVSFTSFVSFSSPVGCGKMAIPDSPSNLACGSCGIDSTDSTQSSGRATCLSSENHTSLLGKGNRSSLSEAQKMLRKRRKKEANSLVSQFVRAWRIDSARNTQQLTTSVLKCSSSLSSRSAKGSKAACISSCRRFSSAATSKAKVHPYISLPFQSIAYCPFRLFPYPLELPAAQLCLLL